jgi:transcriptional regulator
VYIPSYFKEDDWKEISRIIRENGFGILVTSKDNIPIATHIPVELITKKDGTNVLQGHVSKANEQWKLFEKCEQALVIFSAEHHYISSSWYANRSVPTWNFIAIHIYGKMRIVNENELMESLKTLTNHYESFSKQPDSIEQMPQDYINKLIQAVVGFEMTIDKVESKFKLSQNKDNSDYKNVIAELKNLNDWNGSKVAEEMEKRRKV